MKQMTIAFALLFVLIGACANEQEAARVETTQETTQQAGTELTPEQLGELGAKIEKSPDEATELLSEHGLNEESFEQEIRKITEDPEASKRYAAAYEKAKA